MAKTVIRVGSGSKGTATLSTTKTSGTNVKKGGCGCGRK